MSNNNSFEKSQSRDSSHRFPEFMYSLPPHPSDNGPKSMSPPNITSSRGTFPCHRGHRRNIKSLLGFNNQNFKYNNEVVTRNLDQTDRETEGQSSATSLGITISNTNFAVGLAHSPPEDDTSEPSKINRGSSWPVELLDLPADDDYPVILNAIPRNTSSISTDQGLHILDKLKTRDPKHEFNVINFAYPQSSTPDAKKGGRITTTSDNSSPLHPYGKVKKRVRFVSYTLPASLTMAE